MSRKKTNKIKQNQERKKEEDLELYSDLFPTTDGGSGKSVRERAFEKAWEIRNFEIELYWKRATYFWAFIAATFAGYFAVISTDKYPTEDLKELQFYLLCLGFVLSLAWFLVNWGSKKWQENWEGHIDRLEETFTGPLYKTVRSTSSFSVSKINLVVSLMITLVWLALAYNFFVKFWGGFIYYRFPVYVWIGLIMVSAALIAFFTYCLTGITSKYKPYKVRDIH